MLSRDASIRSALLFELAAEAFALPFVTFVSGCGGGAEPATVSGLELATWRVDQRGDAALEVPAMNFTDDTVGEAAEESLSFLATVALALALLGLGLAARPIAAAVTAKQAVSFARCGWRSRSPAISTMSRSDGRCS